MGNENDNRGPKDCWDKASIILKALTAVAVVGLGFLFNYTLDKRRSEENDTRLYTQIISEREKAEQSLRTTMFKEVFDRVLKPSGYVQQNGQTKDTVNVQLEFNDSNLLNPHLPQQKGYGNKEDQQVISIKHEKVDDARVEAIRTHVVGIDMIARNFHEFLDMKPLFIHVMWEIVVARGYIKMNDYKNNEEEFTIDCDRNIGESWIDSTPCQELKWQQITLGKIAGRIVKKQKNILIENGEKYSFEVPLEDVYLKENVRTVIMNSDIPYDIKGFQDCKELSIDTEEGKKSTKFQISVKRAYPNWNMVEVGILWSDDKRDKCENKSIQWYKDEVKRKPDTFWVGSFDFPMVDNTYMSADERYAVVLNDINWEKNEPKSAELELIYFPTSVSGLQEKTYYDQKVFDRLVEEGNVFSKKP